MDNKQSLVLTLKKDWDYFPHYEEQQGHFIGRAEEKDRVKNWFLRREKGCFLVSGERGVGKTALVYQALHEAKAKRKEIVPVIINSLQLIIGEENKGQRDNIKQTLEEIIIVNLIKRLYTAIKDKVQGQLKDDLQDLYRKAVASKSEVREEISIIGEMQQEEKLETEIKTKIKITPENIRYLSSCVGIIIGMTFWNMPPLFKQWHFLNTLFGALCSIIPIVLPLSIYSKIIKYTLKIKRFNTQKAFKELYVKDNSIGNLEYDLFALLDKMERKLKVIFVIDEMDKIDVKPEDVIHKVIKTFKNLFTLSSGIFVFVGGQDIYDIVEGEKEGRGISYTLFNDRVFVSRPNFNDLENYIVEIVENATRAILTNPTFKQFRNLLCYRAKSDFFELHFCLRDYIKKFDGDDRPVLEIELKENSDKLGANIQKALGQIYNYNKYIAYLDWHLNEKLLRSLYDFLGDLNTTIELNRTPSKKDGPFERRIHSAKIDLITYLLRLGYLKKRTEKNVPVDGETLIFDIYDWTGQIEYVPKAPTYLLDYENKFLDSLKRFSGLVNDIDDLRTILAEEEIKPTKDRTQIYNNNVQEFCDINVLGVYQGYAPNRNKLLTPGNPEHILREELDKQTNSIITSITQLENNAIAIIEKMINKYVKLNNLKPSKLDPDANLFGSTMSIIRDGIIKNKLSHICFYWTTYPVYSKQILLVKDIPNDLYEPNKKLINDNEKHHLIVNLNTLGVDYNLEYKENFKNNEKIKGFIDFQISESFVNLTKVIEEIKQYDKKPISREEKDALLNSPIDNKSLREYTIFKYPGLDVSENIHNQLLRDIDSTKYSTLSQIETAVERARPAVEKYANESPDIFKYGTDFISKSLGFVDAGFLQKHPFSEATRNAVKKYLHLVKKQK